MPTATTLEVMVRGDVGLVRLNRPEKRNALSGVMLAELGRALADLRDGGVRAAVLAGAGPAFCAGADLAEVAAMTPAERADRNHLAQETFDAIERLAVPTIAAIGGAALGGGLELALACTFRIATVRARLGFPEIALGVIPTYGGTRRLPSLVGPARATELILTGRRLDAIEAERLGLLTRIVEDPVEAAAVGFAAELTCHSLAALALAQDALRLHRADDPGRLAAERRLCDAALGTADAAEGIRAFIERRPPRFRDA